jgi:hypothetical protein
MSEERNAAVLVVLFVILPAFFIDYRAGICMIVICLPIFWILFRK